MRNAGHLLQSRFNFSRFDTIAQMFELIIISPDHIDETICFRKVTQITRFINPFVVQMVLWILNKDPVASFRIIPVAQAHSSTRDTYLTNGIELTDGLTFLIQKKNTMVGAGNAQRSCLQGRQLVTKNPVNGIHCDLSGAIQIGEQSIGKRAPQ
ncbi:MAG: hypothetical protein COV66_05975 [Nitrospinae bacterium CG11_big_fil_rev_8_21_14_0_20_45_15]|nr:MAG: hypothetical protein COV66_05975 [Nitrospinae bacterium CG11_big_fil_rev_8_21_14_0_20_45_15]